jgi:putative FmdB family regulatory protein
MPTYRYRCPKCGHEYDKFQKITDESRVPCPECGARGERVITGGAGLVFKGSGFYITDYKRAGEKKSEAGENQKKSSHKGQKAPKSPPKPTGDTTPGAKS